MNDVFKLASFFAQKYAAWEDEKSPYEDGPWKKIEGPVDNSLGVPYTAGEATYYKDKLAILWDKVSGPDKELWDRFFQLADSSAANLPVVKRFKELFNDFTARIQNATIKDVLILCAEMMEHLQELRIAVNINRTSDMTPQTKSALDDLLFRIGSRVWERTKKILSIYQIRKGIMNSPEIADLYSASGKGTWHYGPMNNPFRDKLPEQPSDRISAKSKQVSLIDQNLWEEVDKKLPMDGTNENSRVKLFKLLKKQYNEKAKASKR